MSAVCLRLRHSFFKINSYICSIKQTKHDEDEEETRREEKRRRFKGYHIRYLQFADSTQFLCNRIEMVIKINCKHMHLFLTTTTLWGKK